MPLMRRWFPVAAVLLVTIFHAGPSAAAERLAPAAGTLLVAGEEMADPRFRETVILLLLCDEDGVIGLILNRPTTMRLGEAVPELESLEPGELPVYYGGPVDSRLLLALVRTDTPPQNSTPVAGHLYLTGLPQDLSRLRSMNEAGEAWRVFAGLAAWGASQLAGEIERGLWQIAAPDEERIFSVSPENLWEEMHAKGEIWI